MFVSNLIMQRIDKNTALSEKPLMTALNFFMFKKETDLCGSVQNAGRLSVGFQMNTAPIKIGESFQLIEIFSIHWKMLKNIFKGDIKRDKRKKMISKEFMKFSINDLE